MTDLTRAETVRLECLRLAMAIHGVPGSIVPGGEVLATAKALEEYVRKGMQSDG